MYKFYLPHTISSLKKRAMPYVPLLSVASNAALVYII